MADGTDLGEIVRRAVQANAKFYKGWVDLTLEYFRGISEIFGGAQAAVAEQDLDPGPSVLVLEGDEGAKASAAFLVTNDLGRSVSCELVASEFKDAKGIVTRAAAAFEPSKLDLAPGEQRVVRVVVPIMSELAPGVAYTGEFAIKGMDGFAVPVVLRRTHRVGESDVSGASSSGAPTVESDAATAGTAGVKRPAQAKRSAKQKE
jgi:hypothetical protein